jgi:hypothetical protein
LSESVEIGYKDWDGGSDDRLVEREHLQISRDLEQFGNDGLTNTASMSDKKTKYNLAPESSPDSSRGSDPSMGCSPFSPAAVVEWVWVFSS